MATREPIASERRLRAHDKQAQVLELLKEGKTYEQIAEKVGYASKSGAHKAAMTALQQTLQVPADELRILHRERLSLMWDAIFWAIKKGDPQAIDRGLKIMEREAKLMGIDAPTNINVNIQREVERIAEEHGLEVREVMLEVASILKEGVA